MIVAIASEMLGLTSRSWIAFSTVNGIALTLLASKIIRNFGPATADLLHSQDAIQPCWTFYGGLSYTKLGFEGWLIMSVEIFHAIMGFLFCGVWFLVGQILAGDHL